MSIVIDILLILCFVGVLVFFTKYGLESAIHKIGKAWLSLAITFIISPWITGLLEDVFFNGFITNAVYSSLTDLVAHNANGYNLQEVFEHLPEGFVSFLDNLGASLTALEAEFGSYTTASDEILHAMAERIAQPCVSVISTTIALVLGFLLPFLFFRWMALVIKDNHVPFFRVCDHIGGFCVGLVGGYFLAFGLALLTKTAFQVVIAFDASKDLMAIYRDSFVFRFLGEFDVFAAGKQLFSTVATAFSSVMS